MINIKRIVVIDSNRSVQDKNELECIRKEIADIFETEPSNIFFTYENEEGATTKETRK